MPSPSQSIFPSLINRSAILSIFCPGSIMRPPCISKESVMLLMMPSGKVTWLVTVSLGFFLGVEDNQVLRTDILYPVTFCAVVFFSIQFMLMPVCAGYELRLEAMFAVNAAKRKRRRIHYLELWFQVLYFCRLNRHASRIGTDRTRLPLVERICNRGWGFYFRNGNFFNTEESS